MKRHLVLLGLMLTAACSGDDLVRPTVTAVTVQANPNMAVAARVRFVGSGDSVRVRYRVSGAAGDSLTSAVSISSGDTTDIPVLGLLPQTVYSLRAVAFLGTDSVASDPVPFTTGALPADLPAYTAGGTNPDPGYFAFSAGNYGLVIDHTGRVVWYRRFPATGPGLNFMAQPNGHYLGRYATTDPADDDPMGEVDAEGYDVRALRCGNGRPLRFHDQILLADGSYWIMCDESRVQNLSALGGQAAANVTGTVVQHVGPTGAVLFEWSPFGNFLITDADSTTYIGAANVNWTHGNSLDLDTDGNLLVSFRSLSEITKINVATGAVMWRMGGKRNQFTFSGGPNPGFTRQHNLRVTGPGEFIVLDNVGAPASAFERYQWNATTMTATLVQSYTAVPGVQTTIGGGVQHEANGRYLVTFGTTGRVEEFDASGTTLWKINGNPGYVFRIQRLRSLYHPIPALTR